MTGRQRQTDEVHVEITRKGFAHTRPNNCTDSDIMINMHMQVYAHYFTSLAHVTTCIWDPHLPKDHRLLLDRYEEILIHHFSMPRLQALTVYRK